MPENVLLKDWKTCNRSMILVSLNLGGSVASEMVVHLHLGAEVAVTEVSDAGKNVKSEILAGKIVEDTFSYVDLLLSTFLHKRASK
jgi:hypothetical protein